MGIRVRDAMEVEGFSECHVVAGRGGLDRTIEYITVMEVPDVVRWLKGDELLITSLFPIKDEPDAQYSLVPQLVKVGAAALAIKTHRFVETIPQSIIDSANDLDFPIIEIAEHVSYVDIITPLMKMIFRQDPLPQQENFFKLLSEMAMEGQGIDSLLQVLEGFLKNQITLESEIPLISEINHGYDIEPLTPHQKHNLKKSKHSLRFTRRRNRKAIPALVTPILIHGQIHGILTCWQTHREFEENDVVAVERVVPLVALEFLKAKTQMDVELKYKYDRFMDVLTGNAIDEKPLLKNKDFFGWVLSKRYRVIVCDIDGFRTLLDDFSNEEVQVQEFRQSMFRAFERLVCSVQKDAIVGMRSDEFIVFYPSDAVNSKEELQRVKTQTRSLLTKLSQTFPGVTCTAGVSSAYEGVRLLPRAYDEAKKAVRLGRPIWGQGTEIGYEELGIYLLFDPHRTEDDIKRFYDDIIAPIDEYDKDHSGHLLETLTTYFDQNYSLTDTAKTLFVHVNTLKYRLQKVEDLSGCSLNESEGRLHLQFGLKLRWFLFGASREPVS